MAALSALLAWIPAACFGQHSVTQDAGGGRRTELVYNVSDQVVEQRTVDLAGKIQVRVEYEYHPGYLVPQQTTISYWPDGKSARSVTRVAYDENGNFTSEVIALFDNAGTQTGGTKLTHDPFAGIYRCSKWRSARQVYQPAECPASEESAEGPQETKDLTYDEAMKQVELAQRTRAEEQKALRMQRKAPVQPPITTLMKEIGVVLPPQLRPGERVSGSVVDDPKIYESRPDLRLIRMELPLDSQGEAATLHGWTFEAAGGGPQEADGPVTFTVPSATEFSVTLRQVGNPSRAVSCPVSVAHGPAAEHSQQKPTNSPWFEGAALCLKGDLCAVRGPFSGDSTKTVIAFGSRPAPIVAETQATAYISVPPALQTGSTHLIVADGSRVAALPIDVAELSFSPQLQDLRQGQSVLVHARLSGPEELPEEMWRAGVFSIGRGVERARGFVPGFEPPREGGEGMILLVIRNATRQAVSLRGSKDQTFIFKLTPDSFKNGEFTYQFVVEAAQSGGFALHGSVIPFLASVRGRQVAIRRAHAAQCAAP